MPHSSLKKHSIAFLVAALVAVNVVQVQTVFAATPYSLDEAKTSGSGFLGKKVEGAKDLVALIVDEQVWNDSGVYEGLSNEYGGGFLGIGKSISSGDLRGRIERYAEDVRKTLPKTQVMILPVSQDPQTVLKVQQVLERLYLEGDPESSTPTQLRGLVVVGEVPLPVVHRGSQFFMSLLPYTDFVEPEYVFSSATQTFERASGATGAKPEVWHGVIRAPLSGIDGKKQLAEYFDKNHLYHIGDQNFSNFQKKVLISDLNTEAKSLNKGLFPRYENFLKNMEDLSYHRYSAKWLAILKKAFDGSAVSDINEANAEVTALNAETGGSAQKKTSQEQAAAAENAQQLQAAKNQIAAGTGGKANLNTLEFDATIPDIHTVQPIQQYHLQYPQLFGTFLNTITDWATGSGRWAPEDVESIPAIIAKKDLYTMEFLKSLNDSIEAKVDEQVQKLQKPQRLNRNVAVEGHVTIVNTQNGGVALSKKTPVGTPLLDQFGKQINSLFLFINNSLMEPGATQSGYSYYQSQVDGRDLFHSLHYINGLNFDFLTRTQQCSLYGGSQQKQGGVPGGSSGTGAVSQMVQFLRVFNLGTLNASSSGQGGFLDPRFLISIVNRTRPLSSAEALKLTNSKFDYGARVESDPVTGKPGADPANPNGLLEGDIILKIDGKKISPAFPVEAALRERKDFSQVPMDYWRPGFSDAKPINVSVRDANADTLAAGCYGLNYQNALGVSSGKTTQRKCFPEAATTPIADRAGTIRIPDNASISDSDGLAACTTYSSFDLFKRFLKGYNQQGQNGSITQNPGVYQVLNTYRTDPASPLVPPDNSHDPAKIFLADGYRLQDLFANFGLLNGKDDNDDHFDTNGSGKVDRIAWSDSNNNGKLDLWINPAYNGQGDVNVVDPPGFDALTPQQAHDYAKSLDVEEYRKIFPQYFQGSQYTGPYTGEFVGGDWGIDDPSEGTFAYQPVGATIETRWKHIQKQFFDVEDIRLYASHRTQPTKKEYRSFIEAILKKSAGADIKLLAKTYSWADACIQHGGQFCADDTLEAEELLQKTADVWLKFTPNKEKDLSSVAYHKEPTASTLRAQFLSGYSTGLPIDKPRYVSYLDTNGAVRQVVYPNIFQASSLEAFLSELTQMEQSLGAPEGYLANLFQYPQKDAALTEAIKTLPDGQKVFTVIDATKAQSFLEWKSLSSEAKHQQVLEEYLNPEIEGYIDDSSAGYEAMYFVADGKSTYYTTNFSGHPPVDEIDPTYTQLIGGAVVFGDSGAGIASGGGKTVGSSKPGLQEVPSGLDFYGEPVALFEWFDAMKKWWEDTKLAFKKPLGLSFSSSSEGNTFNATVNPGSVAKNLSLSLSKSSLQPRGDSVEVTITAKDASGKIASGDHTSAVWIQVEGSTTSNLNKARVVPDVSGLSEIIFQNGASRKGIFLSDGVAKFQIISGNTPQTLVVRAYGYSEQGQIQSESQALVVKEAPASTPDILSQLFPDEDVIPQGITLQGFDSVLASGGPGSQSITEGTVDLVDEKGDPIRNQGVRYTLTTSGPLEIIGITDQDTETAGYQIDAYIEALPFAVRATGTTGTGVIQVSGQLADGMSFQTQRSISVRDDLHLEMSASSANLPADGGSQSLLTIMLKDSSGNLVPFSGSLGLSLSNTSLGSFASGVPSQFMNGKAFVTVRSGKTSGALSVYATALGLPSASVTLAMQSLPASQLKVTSSVRTLATKSGNTGASGGAGTSTTVSVSFFDSNGNLATNINEPVTIRITNATQKYGFLQTANGSLTNQTSVFSSKGSAAVTVVSRDVAGPIHLVFSAPGMQSAALEIITSGRTGVGRVASFSPNVLYTSVLGGPFGKVTEQNYLAGVMLFNGKTQAAAAVTSETTPHHRIMTLNAFGGITAHDDTVRLQVASSGDNEPLRVDLLGEFGKTNVGSVIIKQQAQPQMVASLGEAQHKAGIFVQDLSQAAIQFVSHPQGLSLEQDQQELARVTSMGGIRVIDPRMTLQVSSNDEVSEDASLHGSSRSLRVTILFSGVAVARVQLGFDAVNKVALLNTPPPLQDLPNGVWLVSNLKDGEIAFESTYSNYSTSDPAGFALVDLSKDAADQQDTIGSPHASLEDALTKPGVGFVGDNKHMLLLAARNTVGESHLSYASEIGIVLGDPTVKLVGDNTKSDTGFTQDLGKNIFTDGSSAQVLLPIDVNADGKKDLLIGSPEGRVRYLQYTGGQQRYIDRGVLIDVANGIRTGVVGDVNNDGKDDLLFAVQENCTKQDTCVDLYRNNGGFFVRENLGLVIDASTKVATMQLADMNQDGSLDLVAALTNGDLRIFMNQKGQFTKVGQLVGTFSLGNGSSIELLVSAKLPDSQGLAGSQDAFPDILTVSRGSGSAGAGSTSSKVTYFMSNGGVQGGNITYAKTEPAQKPSQEQSGNFLEQALKQATEPDAVSDPTKQFYQQLGVKNAPTNLPTDATAVLSQENSKDGNSNGLPDYLDMSMASVNDLLSSANDFVSSAGNKLNGITGAVGKMIQSFRCGEGCFPMPVNHAFLVPGLNNNNGVPSGFQQGIPIFGAAFACSPFYAFWPPCPYENMTFRIYLSPTLTGQLGMAICSGGTYPNATCYAFAPNISLIPPSLCKYLSQKVAGVVKEASSFGKSVAESVNVGGHTVLIANGGASFNGTTDTTNVQKTSDLLAPYKAETNLATNIRVPGFPKFLTDWLDRQIEEVLDKLADLPDLYVMYPSLSSIGRSVVPKVPEGKLSGYTKFLAYLNSIPLISIEPKPVSIRIPSLSPSQILKFRNDLETWVVDFNNEINRVKNLVKCDTKSPSNPDQLNFCQLIDVKATGTLKNVHNLLQSLDKLKELPRKVLEYRHIETKYVKQLINYLQTVSTFLGGYVKRQEIRLGHWLEIADAVKKSLAQWQAIVDITADYNASCDGCKSERFSLFQILTQLFVDIPSPPVVPFPKWPDIILDFSRVEAGIRVSWPDITFTPQQILLPKLPRVHIPIDLSQPKLKLNADLLAVIPTLPELPTIPDLPNLPDLPPLPVFKLPDLPPAPKIPGLELVKGVKIQKHITALKKALEVICLLKKGYITVPEYNLKTQIEELTQRPLTPPLGIDLKAGLEVQYPSISYDAVDQFIVRGKMKLELQTDFIYDFFKQFADSANEVTTDLVRSTNTTLKDSAHSVQGIIQFGEDSIKSGSDGINKGIKDANKKAQDGIDSTKKEVENGIEESIDSAKKSVSSGTNREYRMIAETEYIDPSTLPEVNGSSGSAVLGESLNGSYLTSLQHALERYLADRSALPDYSETYTNQWIAEYHTGTLSQYLAQAGVSDDRRQRQATKYLAFTGSEAEPVPSSTSASATLDVDEYYQAYAEATQVPFGIYIQNASGNAEKLIAYTLEMSRDPKEVSVDIDGDGDLDAIYSLGGDVYLKENINTIKHDAFTSVTSGGLRVADIHDLLPVLPAVHGIQSDYSQKNTITISWSESVQSLPGRSDVAGYEILFRDAFGAARRRYLYEDATGKIAYNANIPTEKLTKSEMHTVSFPLEYGTTFFQVIPLNSNGAPGTASQIEVLAPQVCGDSIAPPLTSAGSSERYVAVSKTLSLDASSSMDVKSSISSYFVDTDTSLDADKDGDPTNDRNIVQDTPVFTVGPFIKEQTFGIKVWSENVQGARSGQAITVHVYVPDIVLSDISLKDGTAYGHVTPVEPQMPFALVRQRGGNVTVLGDYTTDDQGNYVIKGLSTEGKTVIKNAKDEIIAEYEPTTGKVKILKSGYSVAADAKNTHHLILTRIKDSNGTILASFFQVPNANTDTVIDTESMTYTPVTVSGFTGVHLKDTNLTDTYIFRTIAANDPKFFGGTEIINTTTAKRVAVIDSSGHAFFLDSQLTIGLQDIPDMPYIYTLQLGDMSIGQVFIASSYGKPVTVVDGEDFEPSSLLETPSDKPSTTIFSDVSTSSPIFDSIAMLEQNGIIEGYQENGKTLFKPQQLISRAEYTKIVLTALCIDPRAEAYKAPSPFYDITYTEPPAWYYPWVKESYLRNLITGYLGEKNTSGTAPFKPVAYISRAESAKILLEALKMLGILDLSSLDVDPAQAWYVPYLKAGQNVLPYLKKTSGTPSPFIVTTEEAKTPGYHMTRGDFAVMAARVLQFSNCHADKKPEIPSAPEPQQLPEGPNKTSQLPPGVYTYLPTCKTCPCIATLDNTGMLLPGDTIFAILSSKDHSIIYRKSNSILLKSP